MNLIKNFSKIVIQNSKPLAKQSHKAKQQKNIVNQFFQKNQNCFIQNGSIYQQFSTTSSSQNAQKLSDSSKSDVRELKALASMLGMKYQQVNEDIPNTGDIRLVNEQSKQIGIFTLDQALKHTNSKGLDLVLVSGSVSPMICKATNYKEFLYNKFIQEIVAKDNDLKKKKTKQTDKKIQISTKISMGDLKNKAAQTCDFAKKFEKFTVFLYCNDKNIENAKNILYTFADMVRTDLESEETENDAAESQGLQEVEVDVLYLDQNEIDQEDDKITRKVQMTFSSLSYTSDNAQFTQQEIKALISQYFSRSKNRIANQDIAESIKGDISREADIQSQQDGFKQEYEDIDFDSQVLEHQQLTINDNSQEFSEDMANSMQDFAQNSGMSIQKLQEEVEELKIKYDTNAQDALVRDLLREQEQKLKNINRIFRLVNQ